MAMGLNIVTVANKSYYPFLEIFLNSAKKNVPELRKVYVGDAGLGSFRGEIIVKDWVEIVDLAAQDNFLGVHSSGWKSATGFKTQLLASVLAKSAGNSPVFLIDSDVCILKNILELVDPAFDLQVTTMADGGHTRSDGKFIKEIASFMIFNNPQKCLHFVEEWRGRLINFENEKVQAPHETPALNEVLREFEVISSKLNTTVLRIGYLNEDLVCADLKEFPETYAVHFKSVGPSKRSAYRNFLSRVTAVKPVNLNGPQTDYFSYLSKSGYSRWLKWARTAGIFQRLRVFWASILRRSF